MQRIIFPVLLVCFATFSSYSQHFAGGRISPLLHLPGASSATAADTVTIELRDSVSGQHNLIYMHKDTLSSNGNIICTFPASDTGYFYIVAKHRNSIDTWSNGPVHITPNGKYDFTASSDRAYGSNLVSIGNGSFGIYNGDVNGDDNISAADLQLITGVLPQFKVGVYSIYDLTGDGFVDEDDYRIMQNNQSLNITVKRPD